MVYYEEAELFMKLSRTYQISFCEISPLKIRGDRGVMEVMEVTPCVPLTLRGRFKEYLSLRGR